MILKKITKLKRMHRDITVRDLININNKAKLLDFIEGVCCDSMLFNEEELKMMNDLNTLIIPGKQKYTEYTICFGSYGTEDGGIAGPHIIHTDCWECAMLRFHEHIYCSWNTTFDDLVRRYFDDYHTACTNCDISNSEENSNAEVKLYLCLLCFDCFCESCFSEMANHEHRTNFGTLVWPSTENYLTKVGADDNQFADTYDINYLLIHGEAGRTSITKYIPDVRFSKKCVEDYKVLQKICHHKQLVNRLFESDISDEEKGLWWGVYRPKNIPKKRPKPNSEEEN